MIKDNIKNIGRYSINNPFEEFKRIIMSLETSPVKLKFPLKAIHLEYETKEFDLTKFENHHKYIDIHFLVEGVELIGINRLDNLTPNMEYDEENDYQLFDGEIKETIILNSGDFLLLFPGEVHVTGGKVIGTATVKKIVYKIPVNSVSLFTGIQ